MSDTPFYWYIRQKISQSTADSQKGHEVVKMRQRFFIIISTVFVMCFLIFNAPLTSWASSEKEKDIVAEPYLYEGDTHMFNGELEDAQKIYEFILKEDPDNYNVLWRLSRFYISRGMAAEKTKNKKKEWREAEKYARGAIEINPDSKRHLAVAYYTLGDTMSAASELKQALYFGKEKVIPEKVLIEELLTQIENN